MSLIARGQSALEDAHSAIHSQEDAWVALYDESGFDGSKPLDTKRRRETKVRTVH
jgi:hypothetical protein